MNISLNIKKGYIWGLLVISLLFLFSRYSSLTNYPLFTDEAIYIRWAQIAKNDASWRLISLTDGKQPLFIWLTMIVLKWIKDPLLAGRLVSVASGLLSLFGLFFLGRILFKSWLIGLFGAFLYFISPYALVYDRISLMDGTLNALMIWSMIFAVLLVRLLRLDLALILGGLIGLGSLTKTSGFISLYLLPLFIILLYKKNNVNAKGLLKTLCLCLVVSVVSFLIYSVLRLSPFFHIIAQKDKTFILSFSEWFKNPFLNFSGNLNGLFDWTFSYLSYPWVLFILASLVIKREFLKEKLLILCWFLFPVFGLAFLGKVIYPRFIFFMVVPLFLLVAYTFSILLSKRNKLLTLFSFLLLLFPALIIDYDLLTDPTKAKITASDANQYYRDWPSGRGIPESVAYFNKISKRKKIAVYTEGNFGLLPAGLEIFLGNNTNISITGLWPVPEKYPPEMVSSIKKMPTFMVFFQNPPPASWKLIEVLKIYKGNNRYHYVYRVTL